MQISLSAGGPKSTARAILETQANTQVAAQPCAKSVVAAALVKIDQELQAVPADGIVSVSCSLYIGVTKPAATTTG